jgi:hypothetical protein
MAQLMRKPLWVVVVGNPFDGIRLIGPFEDGNDANEWADENCNNEEWWVVNIIDPSVSYGSMEIHRTCGNRLCLNPDHLAVVGRVGAS